MVSWRARASSLSHFDPSVADTELGDVLEEAEYLQKPQDDGYNYNAVQDALDLSLHWDIAIDQPQQQANDSKRDDNSYKWHFIFSDYFF
jgi:hypothetical protein